MKGMDPARGHRGRGRRARRGDVRSAILALLDAAKDWARGAGATHLELDSGLERTDAHRFYEREGPSWKSYSYAWEL